MYTRFGGNLSLRETPGRVVDHTASCTARRQARHQALRQLPRITGIQTDNRTFRAVVVAVAVAQRYVRTSLFSNQHLVRPPPPLALPRARATCQAWLVHLPSPSGTRRIAHDPLTLLLSTERESLPHPHWYTERFEVG